MIYSAYTLNKQGDSIQPWHTYFPIWNQSIVQCLILTVASWTPYWFLRRQVRWSGIPIFFRTYHTLLWSTQSKGFGVVSKAEVDAFLKFSCFFYDSMDVGDLFSGSSAFSKSGLNIWKFSVHVLLEPSLKNFEHYFADMWKECSCAVVWTFFGIAFLWDWNENFLQSCNHYWVFHVCCHIECSTLTASSFRIFLLGIYYSVVFIVKE